MIFRRIFSICIILSIIIIHDIKGQIQENNKSLERFIDRPLTLHKNNLEFYFGYQFGSLRNSFDKNGNRLNMAKEGVTASDQMLNLQLTYGLTERIQLQTLFAYYAKEKALEPIAQKGLGSGVSLTNYIMKSNGFIDPNFKINYLLIKNQKKISFTIGCGISLPVSKYKPEPPNVDSIYVDQYRTDYNFLYQYHNGLGTPVYNLNCAFKLRLGNYLANDLLSKIILRLYFDYYSAPSELLTNDWQYVFDAGKPNGYTFQSLPIKHKQGDWLSNRLLIDWQAFNITSFQIGASNRYYFHGWNQTDYMKIAENDICETNLLVGAHIQATSRLRIDELLSLPIAGKSVESDFTWQIGLIYNLLK